MENIKFLKVTDVKSPMREAPPSAGIDFFVPNTAAGVHYMAPGQSVVIQSGVLISVPRGYVLVPLDILSVAVQKGISVSTNVIDENFREEIAFHLTNTGDSVCEISPGERIVQMLLVKVPNVELVEVDTLSVVS